MAGGSGQCCCVVGTYVFVAVCAVGLCGWIVQNVASLLTSNDDELVPFERPVLFWVPVSMESVEPLLCQRVCGCRPCATLLRGWSVVVWALRLNCPKSASAAPRRLGPNDVSTDSVGSTSVGASPLRQSVATSR